MAMEQRDDIFDFGMMDAEDSLIDEVNPDWRDFADGGDELFWRCGCDTDFVHPESLPVCPICGFVYVPEELALGKVASVERALEDK